MIGQATAHRRANAFAQALEDAALEDAVVPGESTGAPDPGADDPGAGERHSPGRHGSGTQDPGAHGSAPRGSHAAARRADPERATMLALAAALSDHPRPVMDAETKTVQRAQLIAAMEQAIADGSFRATAGRVPEQRTERGSHRATGLRKFAPRSRLSRRLAVGGLTMGVAAGALGGVAAASTNALPGDTLYGLKRSMEDIKLDMAGSDTSRGKVYLDMAATRMQEARRLMDRGRGGHLDDESVGEVRKALSGMHQEASEGHRLLTQAYEKDGSLQPMETLNSFAQSHRQSWSDLRGKLPTQLTDVSDQVTLIFDAIDHEVAPLTLPKKQDGDGSSSSSSQDDDGGTSGSRRTGGQSGSATTGPSPSATADGRTGQDGGPTPSPTASSAAPNGLIGGPGSLLPPPATGAGTPGSTPTSTPTPTHHSVVLPPLLPGLLPGLGLSSDDDPEG